MKIKKILKISAILAILSSNVFAAEGESLDQEIRQIQKDWAISKYKSKTKNEKIDGYRKCADAAEKLAAIFSQNAEPLIWQGICLSSEAELTKLSALGKVKEAKKIFEKAAKIDEKALDGSAYTNLAVLHHRVPGWPIGFGDEDIAEEYFKKVLAIAPNNVDANYFYALFLQSKKDDVELALKHLKIASKAPSRNRPLADSMRKKEIVQKIQEFKEEIN